MKIIRLFIGLLMSLFVVSCDVDRIPETALSDQSFWKSENDLKAAANYLYTLLPGMPITDDIWSDDAFATASNQISDGSRLVPATDADFNAPYRLIRAANNLIEKAPLALSNGVGQAQANVYIGEALFFRAFAYYGLLQRYGDVPLILTTLREDAAELSAPANSRSEVIARIYKDLDEAANYLPTPTTLANVGYGRISKTAAWAFKARAALFEGTRSKFHAYGNPATHLTLAQEAAKKVMDSKEHGLFASYFNLFQLAGEGRQNRENILVKQYGVSVTESIVNHNASRDYQTGRSNPTKALVDSYLMTDGLPITKSPLYKAPVASIDVFTNRDGRLSETVAKRGDPWTSDLAIFTIALLNAQRTGFAMRKYMDFTDYRNLRSYIDLPIIRYAEVLLIYAEATYELSEKISDTDLNLSINLLRQRGKIPALTNVFVQTNGLTMRDEIRRERRVELAMEGHRYWDLIRWKTAEMELPKPILGNYFFASEFGTQTKPLLTADNYILVQEARFRSFKPNRDYLWPLPTNELALNPGLKQNPNW
ncbi:RagB/SusD family nutrient uptake outer membrane protein [Larkinella punicea]|uniref:RagB/SusD family nutrient uptake outer membrane protein n=1 Tax=Larkinella punicea TaxID=2315727 RepID=A0A368JMY2_9BACT|nr:RagB/SusD family nutrient uptake outer membrane protein [Larkinella punicea]RCR67501.1 RagB/SusD family nutrient uptake outer membrane protein [Larkinella punicea]